MDKGKGKDIIMLLFMFIAIIFSGAIVKYTMISDSSNESGIQKKEGLENMQQQNFRLTPGGYPETHDLLLLNPEYLSAKPTNGSSTGSASDLESTSDTAPSQPGPAWQFPTPDNDKCSPMIFCNTFYKERPLGETGHRRIPDAIPLSDSRRRVGFYATDDNNS
jgi:hypothetical protein